MGAYRNKTLYEASLDIILGSEINLKVLIRLYADAQAGMGFCCLHSEKSGSYVPLRAARSLVFPIADAL